MLRKSNSILIKTFAMGALLASRGIAMDGGDEKERKKLDVPSYNSIAYNVTTVTTPETGRTGERDVHRSLLEPHVRNILSQVDERAEMRRELLRKPIKVDLRGAPIRGVLPLDKVTNTLLADAKKYGVPLKLTLLNATAAELDEILSHQDANYIEEFDWTNVVKLIDDMNAYDLEEISEKIDTPTPITDTPTDEDEEWIDDPLGMTTPDELDEEWIDDPLKLTPDELDEEWIDDPAGLRGGGLHAGLPRLRRAVARATHAPILPELVENFGQKGIVAPPKRFVENNESLDIKGDNLHISSWNITRIKDLDGKKDTNSQDVGQFNNLTNHVSHNLVHIFCRENRV
jgi:hypothetical protein